jgi:hypothetical protein
MKVLLALVLTLVLWLAPLVALYYTPTKMLLILGGIAALTCGIAPIIVLVVWCIFTFAIWDVLCGPL